MQYSKKEPPKILYRYTTLNNLALILKNRSIKLCSLNKLDDIVESMTKDQGKFGHDIFVSCWTSLLEESIPFWKMYTQNMVGVRIELPTPFLKTKKTIQGTQHDISKPYMPFHKTPGDIFTISILSSDLIEIECINDDDKLKPIILKNETANSKYFEYQDMGRYKRSHWKFLSEWRFRVIILDPIIFSNGESISKKRLKDENFFLEIDEKAFSKMKIMLGPKTNDEDLEIVKALIKTYNPSAKIQISKLKGEIK